MSDRFRKTASQGAKNSWTEDMGRIITARPTGNFDFSDIIGILRLLTALFLGILGFLGFRFERRIKAFLGVREIPWLKLVLIGFFLYFLFLKDWQVEFSINKPTGLAINEQSGVGSSGNSFSEEASLNGWSESEKAGPIRHYIRRFSGVAVQEMHRFGIPASIKMAQGILESQGGSSRMVLESKNHFGIKCKTKCAGCTCRNYSDDNHFDMFRVFETDWESWREHSLLLANQDRYGKLKNYGKDYKKWAKGLQAAGYATDPSYGDKLIRIIEKYQLYLLDKK